MSDATWTWIHAKVLALAADETSLGDLLPEHHLIGFPEGRDSRIKATARDETARAILDLVAIQAIEIARCESWEDGNWRRVPPESVAALLADESMWSLEVEVTEGPGWADAWPLMRHVDYFDPWTRT